MIRTILKITLRIFLGLAGLAAVIYAGDDLWARFRGKPVEQVKVGRLYVAINHFNETEYSVGSPIMETCVVALLPHFGFRPCWYLHGHPIQTIGP